MVFWLNAEERNKLRACATKLRLLAEEDPQVNLIAPRPPRWELENPDAVKQRKMYDPPDLSKVRFRTRTLIEGLIGLGTLKPGDVPELLVALRQHAVVPAFQERLLESLFMLKEDRVRDVTKLIAGKLPPSRKFFEADVQRQGPIPQDAGAPQVITSRHDSKRAGHADPNFDWSSSTGAFEFRDQAIRRQARWHCPSDIYRRGG